MNILKTLSAAAVLAAAVAAAPAQATIIDVSATAPAGSSVSFLLDPGVYTIEWIGAAEGGAYDAWNPNCPGGSCDSGWTNAYTFSAGPGPNPAFFRAFLPGAGFDSALQSLAAHQGASTMTAEAYVFHSGGYILDATFVFPPPLTLSALFPVELKFYLEDATPDDNFGGVSLRILEAGAAVPEPATWALMIAGFGLAGGALRRRRVAC